MGIPYRAPTRRDGMSLQELFGLKTGELSLNEALEPERHVISDVHYGCVPREPSPHAAAAARLAC